MKATEETKKRAKAAGIASWHVKGEETLQEELAAMEVEKLEPEVLPSVSPAKMTVEELEELLELIGDGTFGGALMSAKMNGPKSKFWKYRDYLEKKVNGN